MKKFKCLKCKTELEWEGTDISFSGVYDNDFEVYKCPKCKREYGNSGYDRKLWEIK